MRFTLADARESPRIAAVFALGVVAAAAAVLLGGGEWGVSAGSTGWLLAVLVAAIAVVAAIASFLPS